MYMCINNNKNEDENNNNNNNNNINNNNNNNDNDNNLIDNLTKWRCEFNSEIVIDGL